MTNPMHRRRFFEATAAAGLAAGVVRTARAGKPGPNETVVVGIMGTGIRGLAHSRTLARLKGAEVAYVCDVDERRAAEAASVVSKAGARTPEAVGDFRKILDDKGVDALIIATCNHWHGPATILACAAGKHVYVEKPCSHNPREGELMIEAARKHDRVVQMGNQRRSWPKIIEAVGLVREGAIGRPYLAKSYFYSNRASIGRGVEKAPPAWIDYALWEGPAPHRPYHDNYLHYTWHYFWHWGNGEVGNNGVHSIDVCRWALGVDFPTRVVSSGGHYHYDDDQQTPDTHTVGFEFGPDKAMSWQGISCNAARVGGSTFDIIIEGTEDALRINGAGYTLLDLQNKVVKEVSGQGGDAVHLTNFLDAIPGNAKLNSEIAEGHRSTLLCHLANIAHRTGHVLHCDPQTGRILNDDDAMALWSREYAPAWEPEV